MSTAYVTSTSVMATDMSHGDLGNQSLTNMTNVTSWMTSEYNPRLVNGIINTILLLANLVGNSLVFYVYHVLSKVSCLMLGTKNFALKCLFCR